MENREQYDVIYARRYFKDGEERVHFMNVGTAFRNDAGTDVILYVVPPPDEKGETRVFLRPAEFQGRKNNPVVEKRR